MLFPHNVAQIRYGVTEVRSAVGTLHNLEGTFGTVYSLSALVTSFLVTVLRTKSDTELKGHQHYCRVSVTGFIMMSRTVVEFQIIESETFLFGNYNLNLGSYP